MIDETYLPFSETELRSHAPPTSSNVDGFVRTFTDSAARYRAFLAAHPDRRGISIAKARTACQIEKDERFWTAASLMRLVRCDGAASLLGRIVTSAGVAPESGVTFSGSLRLILEAPLSSPSAYRAALRARALQEQPVPYLRYAALRRGSDALRPTLEGATRADAVVHCPETGWSVAIEAKVLSDVSATVSYDVIRNQLARNIDVVLDGPRLGSVARLQPDKTVVLLLTPALFRQNPTSRLYGYLMNEYMHNPQSLARDLPHRVGHDWSATMRRIGWATWEDLDAIVPGSCPWLGVEGGSEHGR